MLMFLFKSNVYRPSGTSLLKALFLIRLKGVNFCGVLFCGFFILEELIFADRGQSAKSAKIRTRKIFMLHGIVVARGLTTSSVKNDSVFKSVLPHTNDHDIFRFLLLYILLCKSSLTVEVYFVMYKKFNCFSAQPTTQNSK